MSRVNRKYVHEVPSLLNVTLEEIAVGLDLGSFSAVDLVKSYHARIDEADGIFRSVIELDPGAIETASNLDIEMRKSGRRSPLHGVPILFKDNIFTMDGTASSSGSYAILGASLNREGGVVRNLRQAGAVLLGKANLSEFANFRSKVSNSGWSPRGGQCVGAYYPQMYPAGSSSGSAVATDVGLCFASIGTETQGSLIDPGEANNVVAIKPTAGLVSQDAIIPVSKKHDTAGTLARTVRDSAALLTVIAGKDPNDPRTSQIPFDNIPDYTKSCEGTDLSSMRIGVPWNVMVDVPEVIRKSFDK